MWCNEHKYNINQVLHNERVSGESQQCKGAHPMHGSHCEALSFDHTPGIIMARMPSTNTRGIAPEVAGRDGMPDVD